MTAKRETALARVQDVRARMRQGEVIGGMSELLELVEDALTEAAAEIAAYKGELAARDGRETLLTFDRIGPEGVPTNHANGTLLACTDSDREWVLNDGQWLERPKLP